MNTRKAFTSAYHPQCNGATERMNRTLLSKLMKLCDGRYEKWDEYLSTAVFSCRISPNARLGISPFEALYGRKAKLTSEIVNTGTVERNPIDNEEQSEIQE